MTEIMEMQTPFFSIIIPTYNRAHVLSKAIQSVLGQNYVNWELIIIDDGSTDNTAAVVNDFNDERIKYHPQKNTERSQARNNGIKFSKGKYICFLDSDDEYCNNHLSAFYDFIITKLYPKGIVFSNPVIVNNGIEIRENIPAFIQTDTLSYILTNSIIPDRVCIHHEVFNHYLFNPKVHIGEDTILWAQITNTFPMWHLNEYTVKYLIHDDNSVNLKNNVYRNRLDGLRQLFHENEIKKRLSVKLKNQIISVCFYGIARHFELKKDFFRMTFNAVLSIVYDLKSPHNKAKLYMIYNFFRSKEVR